MMFYVIKLTLTEFCINVFALVHAFVCMCVCSRSSIP